MKQPVSLRSVVEELEALTDEGTAHINRKTGEVFTLSEDDELLIEEEPDPEELPEWQRERLPTIREIVETDDWIELPTKFDIHDWAIMNEFSRSIENSDLSEELISAINGRGAFQRFYNAIDRYGLQKRWDRFRTKKIEEIAADWLEANGIPYTCEEDSEPRQ